MYRTHTCGELRISDANNKVTLAGWVQKSRNLGGMTFIDLRDRYGITQLVFNLDFNADLCKKARDLGREFVIQVKGTIAERSNKNAQMLTGEIEILVEELNILNPSKTPPFTIEEVSDGGDDLRMKYRYLDLRRKPVLDGLILRHRIASETRKYLDSKSFIEVETPVLIKSTPEGARDFVVPSRMNPGEFYALPQSPQTFKQILMVAGFDKYFQIVKCFRDEDLRADRQPEFTQIDCEMSFIHQQDILDTFEGLIVHLFKYVKDVDLGKVPVMSYETANKLYGSDKPDTRFEMTFVELKSPLPASSEGGGVDLASGKGFKVFDDAELVVGICAKGAASYSRKQLDELTEFVKKPQIGAKGLVYLKFEQDGIKSSVDKFYNADDLKKWGEKFNAQTGDLILILSGEADKTRKALNTLRLEMGDKLGLRDRNTFKPLWVTDFPLLEWNADDKRWYAMHHPFTSPKIEDIHLLDSDPGKIRANAYDLVVNGVELGGGSVRIHDKGLQKKMFSILGFSDEDAEMKFSFLMNAFEFGAPPHGGIAFGLDRLCAVFGGSDSIRDYMAFPKNNAGRDMMIDSPSRISDEQLKELNLKVNLPIS
ncbi:MAG: aspartate--tRNA ligase [Chitinophagales bacterium]|mgnify:CR=1 FL=1|nr:aspartate--tRNA ligase [Chitinophagales bacterium]